MSSNITISNNTHISDNKRVALNTLLLYLRMTFVMVISLYTSRIVLHVLGETDFGIYNLVGSIVALFSFWALSMQSAANRFLAFQLGKGDSVELGRFFAGSLTLHVILAVILLIFLEISGYFLFDSVLKIPPDRLEAAKIVFHFSTISCLVTIIKVPYNAAIIAHERMGIYAVICIIDAILKLLLVLVMTGMDADHLIMYGGLLMIIQIFNTCCYQIYCWKYLPETRCGLSWNKEAIKEMVVFSGWNMLGNFSWALRGKGIDVLFNIIFPIAISPILNAAMGIATQVNTMILSFVSSFRMAIQPHIVKTYAQNDKTYLITLLFESSKYSYYLLFFMVMPILLETKFLLTIWLKNFPDYSLIFCQLILINSLFQCFQTSLESIFHASGKMKENQIICSIFFISIIPLAYLVLKSGAPAESVFYVEIFITSLVALGVKFILLHRFFRVSLDDFWRRMLLPCIKVTMISLLLPMAVRICWPESSWLRFLVVGTISACSTLATVYFWGLDAAVRKQIRAFLTKKLSGKIQLT